jgi:hypothetical protein
MNLRLLALLFGLAQAALSSTPQTTWRIQDAPSEVRPIIARADLVIARIQDAFLRELNDTLTQGGAEAAMRSCHIEATFTTHMLGREGIAAGRTSDRLRSPANRAPQWAAGIVSKWAGRDSRDTEGFAVDLGTRIGVLRPITEREMCGHCHGSLDRLTPRVREVLADRYPADRAVGFRNGEIRGWFWVEMPKPR